MEKHHMYVSTKSKQFAAKVHGLQDFSQRIVENGTNIPTAKEVTNYLKYFHSILLGWVKESQPCYIPSERSFDYERFPTADYQLLYDTLLDLLSQIEKISDSELDDALIKTILCTIPFLPVETLLSTPTTLAGCLYDLSPFLQTKLIDLLTQYVIPLIYAFMTPDIEDAMADINLSVPPMLASVLDATLDPGLWTKVMECLMLFKRTVSTDLLTVLAYGTRESLEASIHLLNRYFPPVDIASVKAYQSPPYENIYPFMCQSAACKDIEPQREAVKICLDPALCSQYINEPPPYYLCQRCFDEMENAKSNLFLNVTQPVSLVSQVCDNIDCRFGFMKALYFCFSRECTKKNENKPIRLCEDCHIRLHVGLETPHMNHQCLKELWVTPNPEQTYLVDAIVRLWNEAQPDYKEKCIQMGVEVDNLFLASKQQQETLYYLKKIFRSFHGLWLLKTTCPIPPTNYHLEHLGRLLSMLFVWVESVEYASHAKVVQIVKSSRQQAIAWINKVLQYDIEMYCDCLLPDPPMYARVGHPWDMLTSVVRKNLEILQRLVTLTKYSLIPEQVWEKVMPLWIEEIKVNTPVDEIKKFKKVLGRLFDIQSEIRPTFATGFIKAHLQSSTKQSQEGLVWVQILSYLDVQLEIKPLLEMFIEMIIISTSNTDYSTPSVFPFPDKQVLSRVNSVSKLSRQNSNTVTTPITSNLPALMNVTNSLTVSILMMDVLIKQLSLQKTDNGFVYVAEKESISLNLLLVCILDQSFTGEHSDHHNVECTHCQIMNVLFYQVSLLIDLAVKQQVTADQPNIEYTRDVIQRRASSNASKKSQESLPSKRSQDSLPSMNVEDKPITNVSLKLEAEANCQLMSEAITEIDEEEDLLHELDALNDLRKQLNNLPSKINQDEMLVMQKRMSDISSSVLFAIPELQIMQSLVQQLSVVHETSVMIHILSCLEIVCIRGECLRMVAEEDIDLLNTLQTVMFIPCLWNLLHSSCSNIAERVVPLLLHCACLPYGADKLCEEFENDFTNEDWKFRFAAVEKIGLICQFLSNENIRNSPLAQSTIVHGLSFLIYAVEDVVIAVASKARSIIGSLKISSLKYIHQYMTAHFEQVQEDRLVLLHNYRTMYMIIPESSPISGEFFVSILKTLKVVDDKNKFRPLFKDRTLQPVDTAKQDSSLLSIYSRMFGSSHKTKVSPSKSSPSKTFGKVGFVPLTFYRNCFTLQAGKSWRDGNVQTDFSSAWQRKQSLLGTDIGITVEAALDTVVEESDNEKIASRQSAVTSDVSSNEDEVLSLVLVMIVEFLSSKIKPKIEEDLGKTEYEQIREIIHYIGNAMGFEVTLTDNWRQPKKMHTKTFRKNPVFVTLLLNLPKLLDGVKELGAYFMNLALAMLETCVKRNVTDNLLTSKLTLMLLDPVLQYAWLRSLIVIIYKHDFHDDHREVIWKLVNVVKNTLDGHGNHICSTSLTVEPLSLHHIANLKVKTKRFKSRRLLATASEDDLELTEFADAHDSQHLDVTGEGGTLDSRGQRPPSELMASIIETTEDLMLDLNYKECLKCKLCLFRYDEETINLSIVCLLTLIHMDAVLAAPFVIDVIQSVSRKAGVQPAPDKPPQLCLTVTASIAQQFLRCVYNQLAPSRLFPEMFRVSSHDDDFFVIMAMLLHDFTLLTPLDPVKLCLQDIIDSKSNDQILPFLNNLMKYIQIIVKDPTNKWITLQNDFEDFFKIITPLIPSSVNLDCLLNIMSMLLASQKGTFKLLIEQIDDVMTHVIKNCIFTVKALQELCMACNESFTRERDQIKLTRKICLLLSMILSSKIALPETTVTTLVQFFCNDVGTVFYFENYNLSHITNIPVAFQKNIRAVELLHTNYSHEIIEYLKAPCRRLKEPQSGDKMSIEQSMIKLSIAQFIAVYLSKIDTENRMHTKIMNLVIHYQETSDRLQSATTNLDVHELITHFRIYCWVLLAALNHSNSLGVPLPHLFPVCKAICIAEFIEVVFQTLINENEDVFKKAKSRAQLHFSFLLAQIWTVYMEQHSNIFLLHPAIDVNPLTIIKEFWSRLTPMLYALLLHSPKMRYETIKLFSSLVESLSTHCPRTFTQLFPLWLPMLQLYISEIPNDIVNKINSSSPGEQALQKQLPRDCLGQWIASMHEKLWVTEKMLRGKFGHVVTV